MNNEHLLKYIQEGFAKVTGFCPTSTLTILDYLDNLEQKSGGALEIGGSSWTTFYSIKPVNTTKLH